MSPRKRKPLDPKSKDFSVRFALHLRGLLDERELTQAEFRAKLNKAGLDVSKETVKKWVSGENVPLAQDFEPIAKALKVVDYRMALPPPR